MMFCILFLGVLLQFPSLHLPTPNKRAEFAMNNRCLNNEQQMFAGPPIYIHTYIYTKYIYMYEQQMFAMNNNRCSRDRRLSRVLLRSILTTLSHSLSLSLSRSLALSLSRSLSLSPSLSLSLSCVCVCVCVCVIYDYIHIIYIIYKYVYRFSGIDR
jgi:hypothetical protein